MLQPDLAQSQVLNLIQRTRNYSTTIQDGILTGGQVSLNYSESYLNENAPTDVLNPTYVPSLALSVQHNFLSGFGVGVNSRTINVWKTNLNIDNYNFRSQVTSVIVNVLQTYYTYSADFLNVGARQRALDVANEFLRNNRKQVEIGTLAPLDVTNAEAQVATSESDLVVAKTTLEQDEVTLKSLLSRTGTADPVLSAVDIVPLDHIDVPETDNLPPFQQLVSQAVAHRPDLASERLNLHVSELNSLGTKSAVLTAVGRLRFRIESGIGRHLASGPIGTAPGSRVGIFQPSFPAGLRTVPGLLPHEPALRVAGSHTRRGIVESRSTGV